jgi:membrane-anchored mycosin MYCP
VSISNGQGGGLANGSPNDQQEMVPLNGTSYAAAYVSGVAALVRSKFPKLSAADVIHRISATARGAARTPSNLVGAGNVDAVAALTWDVPAASGDPMSVRPVAAPPAPPVEDTAPRNVALFGTAALTLAVIAAVAVAAHRRKDPAS